ncbi:hypothetical protein DA83_05365 [Pseudomonas sp. 250J]|nr:hypothetical protein DA83_05365 [Pseudomonas sp. 250J]
MQIAAYGLTAGVEYYLVSQQCIADKVTDSKMTVQRQAWAGKGKAARHHYLQSVRVAIEGTQSFLDPLTFPIGT